MKALAGKLCLIVKGGANVGKTCRALRLYEGTDYTSTNGSPLWYCEPVSSGMTFVNGGTHQPWVGPVKEFLCTESSLMPIDPDETFDGEDISLGLKENENARV